VVRIPPVPLAAHRGGGDRETQSRRFVDGEKSQQKKSSAGLPGLLSGERHELPLEAATVKGRGLLERKY